ncbi:RNA polymerase subunit sigma-70 [bacterium DOLZORAL124_64_63]|nr:MAG: RNA polymerase subunit sigma-70 [bacterium DOLZORAL124_64_63]
MIPEKQAPNFSNLAEQEDFPALYTELRTLAGRYMSRERADHTLQPTALVHELFLRLEGSAGLTLKGRAHFMVVAARTMRRILIDHARAHAAKKRKNQGKVSWLELQDFTVIDSPGRFLDLEKCLNRLSQVDARAAAIMELRFFGDLDVGEIAKAFNISERLVRQEIVHSRAWLLSQMGS